MPWQEGTKPTSPGGWPVLLRVPLGSPGCREQPGADAKVSLSKTTRAFLLQELGPYALLAARKLLMKREKNRFLSIWAAQEAQSPPACIPASRDGRVSRCTPEHCHLLGVTAAACAGGDVSHGPGWGSGGAAGPGECQEGPASLLWDTLC